MKRPFEVKVLGLAVSFLFVACDGGGSRELSVRTQSDMQQAALEAEQIDTEIARARALSEDRTPAASKPAKSEKSPGKKTAATSPAETVYVVQIGVFKVEANADRLEKTLKDKGLPVMKKKIEREGGEVLYMVRMEPTPTRTEAEHFVASLKAAGQPGVILKIAR